MFNELELIMLKLALVNYSDYLSKVRNNIPGSESVCTERIREANKLIAKVVTLQSAYQPK